MIVNPFSNSTHNGLATDYILSIANSLSLNNKGLTLPLLSHHPLPKTSLDIAHHMQYVFVHYDKCIPLTPQGHHGLY